MLAAEAAPEPEEDPPPSPLELRRFIVRAGTARREGGGSHADGSPWLPQKRRKTPNDGRDATDAAPVRCLVRVTPEGKKTRRGPKGPETPETPQRTSKTPPNPQKPQEALAKPRRREAKRKAEPSASRPRPATASPAEPLRHRLENLAEHFLAEAKGRGKKGLSPTVASCWSGDIPLLLKRWRLLLTEAKGSALLLCCQRLRARATRASPLSNIRAVPLLSGCRRGSSAQLLAPQVAVERRCAAS